MSSLNGTASDATSSVIGVSQLELAGTSKQQTDLTGGATDSIFMPQQQRVRVFARAKIELPVTSGVAKAGSTWTVELNNAANRAAFHAIGKVTIQSSWPAIRHKDEKPREHRKPHKHACQEDNYSFASLNGGSSGSSSHGSSSSSHDSSSSSRKSSSSSSYSKCPSSSSSSDSCSSSSGTRSSSGSSSSYSDNGSSHSSHSSHSSGATGPCWEVMPKCGEGEVVYYVNSHGNWVFRDIQFTVGPSQRIQNFGEHLEILDEMVEGYGKDTDETVGRFNTEEELWRASRECNVRTARLHFFFTTEIAKILQIYRITVTKLALVITTRKLQQLFYASDKTRPYLMESECLLQPEDIQFRVMADVYWFTAEEMNIVRSDAVDESYLIQEFQKVETPICCPADKMSEPIIVDLPFHNIVQSWIYFVQAEHHVCNKEWLNYSGRKGRDPIVATQLLVNGMEASVKKSARDARVVSALECDGYNVPSRHLYLEAYAITPTTAAVATGGLDFEAHFLRDSKAKIQQKLWLQRKLGRAKFVAFASSYNQFLTRANGTAEIVYRQTPA